ncbi:MAG: ATP-binding cassette domain-containing protein [Clostridia bacterium]|nr:ATP-binding cassette domain-containing protein [Clostridia bacterium]
MGLTIKNVNKSYGDKKVVDNISLEINKPGVYGLLGTNGAGKTTTIRMLLGILKKDSGEINWNGKEVKRKHVNFGYLPEERGVYPKVNVYTQLMYFAKLKGMKEEKADEAIKYWMKRLEVEEYMNMTAEKLSKGNQQKIQFITAVVHDPELIVLDEPFSGLDPVNTEIIRNVILELIKKGKYIIMSAHQMSVVEEFCSDVLILNKGKTVLQGNLKQIKDSYKANKLYISTKQDIKQYIKEQNLNIYLEKDNEYEIDIKEEEQGYKLFNVLAKNNVQVEKFEIRKPSLHDIFIEKVGE